MTPSEIEADRNAVYSFACECKQEFTSLDRAVRELKHNALRYAAYSTEGQRLAFLKDLGQSAIRYSNAVILVDE